MTESPHDATPPDATPATPTTPVRALGSLDDAGYRVLRRTESTYRDGGEEAVLAIITAAHDLGSASDEMVTKAVGWAQRYHLDPARANVLRGLALPPDAKVLEIGAGCGAITRYLGETCAVVDSLEPVPIRAAAAVARTRDLNTVQVLVGELADIPATPTYDVIVVVGVLEYVGTGSAHRAPYLAFLDAINARLVDGGTLVLAIENKLGVKYLVGAPEDHTNRAFDSIEDYPLGSRARTFSRLELEALLTDSGLIPDTKIAFPDYKMTRAVFADLPPEAASLLHRVPRFPSPDWRSPRPRLSHEAAVWRTIVEAGLATEFGNSFLVLAGKGTPSGLWPTDTAGVFYSSLRLPALGTVTVIESDSAGVRFRRHQLVPGTGTANGIHTIESVSPFCPGRDLTDVLAEAGTALAGPYLEGWLKLLDEATSRDGHVPMDLVPHNLVVADDGSLQIIDIELVDEQMDRDQVIRRAIYWFTERLTRLAPPPRWAPHQTVGDVMTELGALVGLPADGSWLAQLAVEEAALQVRIRPGPPAGLDRQSWQEKLEKEFRGIPNRTLTGLAIGERLPEKLRRTEADLKRLKADLKQTRADLKKAQTALKAARATPTARASRAAKRAVGKALPKGSAQRKVVDRLRAR